jgi:YidC/Oxa1 family membrane protein insertase
MGSSKVENEPVGKTLPRDRYHLLSRICDQLKPWHDCLRHWWSDCVVLPPPPFSQYFASIFYNVGEDTTVKIDRDRDNNPVVFMEGTQNFEFNGYIGPKDYKILHSIKPELTNAIEYGWFTFAAAPLFQFLMFLHGIVGNWGWAIVILTIIIRILLFPLTFKGMLSMQKLKEVSPKVKELQAKYKGDPQRMNAAVMELYKKEGANPLGGCLPLLLQIPVFFAIYRVLLNAVELKGAEWVL